VSALNLVINYYSFILDIPIAPFQVHYCSEVPFDNGPPFENSSKVIAANLMACRGICAADIFTYYEGCRHKTVTFMQCCIWGNWGNCLGENMQPPNKSSLQWGKKLVFPLNKSFLITLRPFASVKIKF